MRQGSLYRWLARRSPSKYKPHQGPKECARRVRQGIPKHIRLTQSGRVAREYNY